MIVVTLLAIQSANAGERDHKAFRANLAAAGVADRVRHVRLPSQDALGSVAGQVDLLYIDGAHRYLLHQIRRRLSFPATIAAVFLPFGRSTGTSAPA